MSIIMSHINADDMYLIGNIAAVAIKNGEGALAEPLLKFMQEARPNNAGSFVLEAMYLHSIGRTEEARLFLEDSGAFQAERNRDEALAFHLYLIQQSGHYNLANELGQAYLAEGLITSESSRAAVSTVMLEIADSILENNESTEGKSGSEDAL